MKMGKGEMQSTRNSIKWLSQKCWPKKFSLPPQSFPWIAPPHVE